MDIFARNEILKEILVVTRLPHPMTTDRRGGKTSGQKQDAVEGSKSNQYLNVPYFNLPWYTSVSYVAPNLHETGTRREITEPEVTKTICRFR